MEFLLFPATGLVLGTIIFLSSGASSRRMAFYMFWLIGVLCLVMSLLTFLTSSSQERMQSQISFHGIFALVGIIAVVAAAMVAGSQERAFYQSQIMEERQYRAASEITQLAASNNSLLELLNFSLDKIVNMLGLSGGAIHVFHRARENLVLGSYMGLTARLARRLETIEFGDTSIGRTAKNKRLLIIRDLRLSQDYEFFGGKQEGFSYMALISIVSEGENWGVISLFGKGPYQPGSLQVDLLEQFGEQLGAALVLGRQVRNMQAARESLSQIVKAVGQELNDSSAAKRGIGAARAVAWAVTRFFGGDRYDICARSGDNWTVTNSSEPGVDGKPLTPTYSLSNIPFAGAMDPNQPPFREFADGKGFIYTSLFVGRDWFFVRLEGRRRSVVDYELLSDSFRIIYGLFSKFEASAKLASTTYETGISMPLAGIAADLDRLIRQYSDIRNRPEMQELFIWLESIQKAARDGSRAAAFRPAARREVSKERGDVGELIRSAIEAVSANEGTVMIEYIPQSNTPVPNLPGERLQRSLLEFFTAALRDSHARGSLKLAARGENRSIVFELQGEGLAEPPRAAERLSWLREINGRLESRKVVDDNGQAFDAWRLSVPLESESSDHARINSLKVLAVDNQDAIRDLLASMLTNLGHRASVVAVAGEARALFNEAVGMGEPFDIILADYSLRDISGLELMRELKALDDNAHSILLSGWGLPLDPNEASRMGVDFILVKPFRLEQLAEAIRTVSQAMA
jgi:CheY-like chemotaxis protein